MAGSVNKVILVGNLGGDPDIRSMQSGDEVANLNIATMRVFRRSVGGDAMVALELDGSADTELIARLSALQGVYHVAYLAAKEE